jgi:hypothetical protein
MVQAELPAALNLGVSQLAIEAGGRASNTVSIFTEP